MKTSFDYVKDFPFSCKWKGLVQRIAYLNHFSFNEGFQEALILEWELSKKIRDLKYRENYFKKVLYRRLYSIGNDWWKRHKVELLSREEEEEYGGQMLDQIVVVRAFDTVFFEEMIVHITEMLLVIDNIASEMFVLRIKEKMKWNTIRRKYSFLAHNKFYDKVKLIKDVVYNEILNDK